MPRLVRMHLNGPIKIEPSDKPVWVCGCGLSRTFPICDKAHKACREREPDPSMLYVYDSDRREIVEVRSDVPPPEPAPVILPPQSPGM